MKAGRAVRLGIALSLLACASVRADPMQDAFPGDREYTARVRALLEEVRDDAITLTRVDRGRPLTREALCRLYVDRHREGTPGERSQTRTQQEWLACPDLDGDELQAACVEALEDPRGYDGPEGWARWAGDHTGRRWKDSRRGRESEAAERWREPREILSSDIEDRDRDGRIRRYDIQDIYWPGRETGRFGWNQSHPDVPYVWGWDPQERGNTGGDIGTRVGFTIDRAPCHFVLWINAREAFFDGINARSGARTSTDLDSRSQWSVD